MKNTENTKKFADRLIDLIQTDKEINGTTIAKLSKTTGIPTGSLSKYQNDEAEPGLNALCKLADYFNVSVDYLTGREECTTHENQSIYEKLGLYDISINVLKMFQVEEDFKKKSKYNINLIRVINYLLGNDQGWDFLGALTTAINAQLDYMFMCDEASQKEDVVYRIENKSLDVLLSKARGIEYIEADGIRKVLYGCEKDPDYMNAKESSSAADVKSEKLDVLARANAWEAQEVFRRLLDSIAKDFYNCISERCTHNGNGTETE